MRARRSSRRWSAQSDLGRTNAERTEELQGARSPRSEDELDGLESEYRRGERASSRDRRAARRACDGERRSEETAPAAAASARPAPALRLPPPTAAPADPAATLRRRRLQRRILATSARHAAEARGLFGSLDESAGRQPHDLPVSSTSRRSLRWSRTGPASRSASMVSDEVQTILKLADTLGKRVVGQDHGLQMIAKRIETNRAKLDNPNKPIGVFMLCGPSGVGKTETALALAEALYGGEQNMITINMSRVPGGAHRLAAQGRASRLCRLRRGRPADRGGAAQALQRRAARRGREGASRRARAVLPGVRQGHDGGRQRPQDQLQEHPDHPDLECRHGGHHEDGRRGQDASPIQQDARAGDEALPDAGVPAGAARPHRDHPVFPAVGGDARRHRPAAAQPHQAAHRRQPRRRVRVHGRRRRAHRVAAATTRIRAAA